MDVIDWNYRGADGTYFDVIFQRATDIITSRKMVNSNLQNEMEKTYFRFIEYVERSAQFDIKEVLGQSNRGGETVFLRAATLSEKISKDMLLRNVNVNYVDQVLNYPSFKNGNLTQLFLEKGLNPFIVHHFGKSEYDLFRNNFKHVKRQYLEKYLFDQNGDPIIFDPTHSEKTAQQMPFSNPATCFYYSIHQYQADEPSCIEYKNTKMFVPYLGIKSKKRNRLGGGAEGTVFEGKWNGKAAAFKHIGLDIKLVGWVKTIDTDKNAKSSIQQFSIISNLKHKNIVQMYHTYRQQTYDFAKRCSINETVIVMEKCDSDLNSLPPADRPLFYDLMKDIVSALEFIDENRQVHGDIKNGNILLKRDQNGKWVAVLTDHAIFEKGGTPIFMAPEGLCGQTSKSDIYSLGVTILFNVLEIPFALELLYFPLKSKKLEAANFLNSIPVLKLITAMIDVNPENRPSFDEMIKILKNLSKNYNGSRIGKAGLNTDFLNEFLNDAILGMNLDARHDLLQNG